MMTKPQDTSPVAQIIRRLRKQLTAALLELDKLEQMIDQPAPEPAPVAGKRKNKYQEQIRVNEATGSWRKPASLKAKTQNPRSKRKR